MIELLNLSKSYEHNSVMAIEDVSLKIKNGEVLGLAGLNGAGKTTAIKICSGVMFPTSGTVLVDGLDIVKKKRAAAMEIAWVPESPIFDLMQKPRNLFREFGSYFGFSRESRKDKMNAVMSEVGLEKQLDQRIQTFSNGMRKRLMLAFALFQDPKNFLLDETFDGLDPEGIRFLEKSILRLKSEGKSILLSSHVLSEFEGIVDRIAVIHHGHILDVSPVEDLLRSTYIEVECRGDRVLLVQTLQEFGSVVEDESITLLRIDSGKGNILPEISGRLSSKGLEVLNIREYKNGFEGNFFWQIHKK